MILYADILFIVNFSMDFLALYISGKILKKRMLKIRTVLSSCLGALYAILSVVFSFSVFLKMTVGTLCAIAMCKICFCEKGANKLLLSSFIYFSISALLGGIMSVLYSFLNEILAEFIEKYSQANAYNGIRFSIIVLITLITTIIFAKIIFEKKCISVAHVTVQYGNDVFTFDALCDSGNLLKEPVSGKSVILVAEKTPLGEKIKLTQDIYKRYIPYKDIHGEGVVKGVLPNKVIIDDCIVDTVIAAVSIKDFNGYEALVPMSLI